MNPASKSRLESIETLLLAIGVHGPAAIHETSNTAALRHLFKRDKDGFRKVRAALEEAGTSRADVMELVEPTNNELDQSTQDREDDATIIALADLSQIAYAKRRPEAAAELGITVKDLDKAVAKKRSQLEAEHVQMLYPHWEVEPWEAPVDGGMLLQMLVKKIRRHVVMSSDQALAVALWVMLTWIHETAAVHSPLLLVTSAEANSGKSTLIGMIEFLARRSLLSVSITGPALFRSIEKWQPTFAIDEADTVLVNNEDLKEVINSGWTRGQNAIRCDPETNEPRPYSTFCPKALGMKGRRLPDTTLSRAIIIEMKRKLPNETAVDFDHVDDAEFTKLRRQLSRWANDHAATLAKAVPEIPPGFHNRVKANWKLLLAIAEKVGGEWKRQAWQAAGVIEKVKATFESSIGVTLLEAIRGMFEPDTDCLLSREIINKLVVDPEQPWGEYKRGKPITPKQLAGLLGQFQIISGTVHPPDIASGKGYRRQQFEEAFGRYLAPSEEKAGSETSIRPSATAAAITDENRSVRATNPDGSKNDDLSHSHAGLDGWTDGKPENTQRGRFAPQVEPANDLLEVEIDLSPTAVGRTEPVSRPPANGNAIAPAQVVQVRAAPFEMPDLPSFLDARRRANRPALGPPGDSLDDFK
jgi:putative DNA primase/helicase